MVDTTTPLAQYLLSFYESDIWKIYTSIKLRHRALITDFVLVSLVTNSIQMTDFIEGEERRVDGVRFIHRFISMSCPLGVEMKRDKDDPVLLGRHGTLFQGVLSGAYLGLAWVTASQP